MKKKSLVLLLALSMILTFALGACGKSGGSEGGDDATLKVVTEATFAPFEFTEDGSEEIVGFDVDMMNAIAEDQGLKIEWVNMEFDSLIPALESDQGDIICAGMNKLASVVINGNAGVGVAENMMSGFVHVRGDVSQSAGATAHGGLLGDKDGQALTRAHCGCSVASAPGSRAGTRLRSSATGSA